MYIYLMKYKVFYQNGGGINIDDLISKLNRDKLI